MWMHVVLSLLPQCRRVRRKGGETTPGLQRSGPWGSAGPERLGEERQRRKRRTRGGGECEGMAIGTGLSACFALDRRGGRRARAAEKKNERRNEWEKCNRDEWSLSKKGGETELKKMGSKRRRGA